jgi:hypothetical protein
LNNLEATRDQLDTFSEAMEKEFEKEQKVEDERQQGIHKVTYLCDISLT